MRCELRVTTGSQSGRRMWLADGQTIQIGRTEYADLCIGDDPLMSRVHFALDNDGGKVRLRDLGSRNGTYVNGSLVKIHELNNGDMIVAGQTRFDMGIELSDAGGPRQTASSFQPVPAPHVPPAPPNQPPATPAGGYPGQPAGQQVPTQPWDATMPQPGVPQPGVPQPGVPQPGMPRPGTPQAGTPQAGMPQGGSSSVVPQPGQPYPAAQGSASSPIQSGAANPPAGQVPDQPAAPSEPPGPSSPIQGFPPGHPDSPIAQATDVYPEDMIADLKRGIQPPQVPAAGNQPSAPPAGAGQINSPIRMDADQDVSNPNYQTVLFDGNMDESTLAYASVSSFFSNVAYVESMTPGGISSFTNATQPSDAVELAKSLIQRNQVYLLINIDRIDPTTKSYVDQAESKGLVSRISGSMVLVSKADAQDALDLFRSAWGKDACSLLISRSPKSQLQLSIGHRIGMFTYPSVLSAEIENTPVSNGPKFFHGIEAVMVERPGGTAWCIYLSPGLGHDWTALGMPCPPNQAGSNPPAQ